MDFYYGNMAKLLERHQALMDLAKYLSGDSRRFLEFVEVVCQLERSLEEHVDTAAAQYRLVTAILKEQFKRVMVSQEWQRAGEYLAVPSNEKALLEVYYRLDIGTENPPNKEVAELRRSLLHAAFFQDRELRGKTRLDGIAIQFVFSAQVPRWALVDVEWELENTEGPRTITGSLVVSVGLPQPDGPPLYRDLYAWCGSELKAASIIAAHGIAKQETAFQTTASEILQQADFELEKLRRIVEEIETPEAVERWASRDLLSREYSGEGLSFLVKVMERAKGGAAQIYQYLEDRLKKMGFALREESPCGYAFSEEIAKGELVRSPRIEYYWPYDDSWEVALPGYCRVCAGPPPEFLKQLYRLAEDQILAIRDSDLDAVEQMLFYLVMGNEKIARPPILPVYNALRRWLEELSAGEDYLLLDSLCHNARIFRPHIQIPHVGEKPFAFAGKEHTLLPQADDRAEGTIVGIKQAGMMVPDAKMPLFLPGVFWVAKIPDGSTPS